MYLIYPEYNPKLEEESVATRVAYVKFMAKTFAKREEESENQPGGEEDAGDDKKKRAASRREGDLVSCQYIPT